jgi:hypothetical protein
LYSNTTLTNAITGIGPVGSSLGIVIDDVLVPVARDPAGLPLDLTQITVGVGGAPTAPPGGAITFSLWTFPVLPDGSPGLPQQSIGTQDQTFVTGPFQNLAFGDGTSTLATVQPNLTAVPGYGLFYIGLSASATAGWSWANGPDFNLPTAYFYNGSTNTIYLDTPAPGFPSNESFYLQIEGTPVPEPSLWPILAGLIAGFCGLRFAVSRVSFWGKRAA